MRKSGKNNLSSALLGFQRLVVVLVLVGYGLFTGEPVSLRSFVVSKAPDHVTSVAESLSHPKIFIYSHEKGEWVEDEEDACHSSPEDRAPFPGGLFVQIQNEERNGGNHFFPLPALHSLPAFAMPGSGLVCFPTGTVRAFRCVPRGYPVFLISDLPPPLTA